MTAAWTITLMLQFFSASLYASLPATVTVFALVVTASVGVDAMTRARVERQTESLEFQG